MKSRLGYLLLCYVFLCGCIASTVWSDYEIFTFIVDAQFPIREHRPELSWLLVFGTLDFMRLQRPASQPLLVKDITTRLLYQYELHMKYVLCLVEPQTKLFYVAPTDALPAALGNNYKKLSAYTSVMIFTGWQRYLMTASTSTRDITLSSAEPAVYSPRTIRRATDKVMASLAHLELTHDRKTLLLHIMNMYIFHFSMQRPEKTLSDRLILFVLVTFGSSTAMARLGNPVVSVFWQFMTQFPELRIFVFYFFDFLFDAVYLPPQSHFSTLKLLEILFNHSRIIMVPSNVTLMLTNVPAARDASLHYRKMCLDLGFWMVFRHGYVKWFWRFQRLIANCTASTFGSLCYIVLALGLLIVITKKLL